MPTIEPSLLSVSNAAASAASSATSQAMLRSPAEALPDRDKAATLAPRRARSLAIAAPRPRARAGHYNPTITHRGNPVSFFRRRPPCLPRHPRSGRPAIRKLRFRLEAFAERKICSATNRSARKFEGSQAEYGELASEGHTGLERLAVNQPIYEPNAKRFFRFNRTAGHNDFEGARLANQPGKPLRAAITGDQAEFDLG